MPLHKNTSDNLTALQFSTWTFACVRAFVGIEGGGGMKGWKN
jgi:hypothetical protein